MKITHSLVCPFLTDDPEFARGVEFGMLYARMSEAGHAYDPPDRLLPMPVKEGDTWEWEKPFVKWKFTAGKEEEVAVPAGTYKARRLDGVGAVRHTPMQAEPTPSRCSLWYAPDLGVVKSVIRLGDDKIVEVLKSFTPGPAKQ